MSMRGVALFSSGCLAAMCCGTACIPTLPSGPVMSKTEIHRGEMFVPDNLTAIPKAHPDYSEELPSSSAVLATNAMNDIKANTPVTSEMLGVVIIKASRPIKKGTVLSRDNAQPDVVPSLSDLGKGFRFNNLANVDDWLSRVPKATVDISQGKTINRSETTVPSYYQGE